MVASFHCAYSSNCWAHHLRAADCTVSQMFFLFIVIPEGCVPGIQIANHYSISYETVDKASFNGSTRDILFYLSFCPEESGKYDILYEGNIDTKNEAKWSSYSFNGTVQKTREFKNLELREGVCYKVSIGHATNVGQAWGRLEYTHNGVTRVFSSADSFSCPIGWCKNGGVFPQCLQPPTVKFTGQESRFSKLFALLLGLLLLQ